MTGVRYFVEERKADIDIEYPTGLNALWVAAKTGNVDMISLFFELFDHKKWQDDDIAFFMVFESAAEYDHAVVFDTFLKRSVDFWEPLEYFHFSFSHDKPNLLQWFLENGADPDHFDSSQGNLSFWDDMTPLQRFTCDIIFDGTLKQVKRLLNAGANVNFPLTPPISKRPRQLGGEGKHQFLLFQEKTNHSRRTSIRRRTSLHCGRPNILLYQPQDWPES
jgi:hypothetical protein